MERSRIARNELGALLVTIALATFAVGCSSSGDDERVVGPESAPPAGESEVVTGDDDLFTRSENESLVDDEGQPVESVVESLAPVPETGVPGIESDDAFCRSWSTYAGSVQAISLAWALQSASAAASLEVAATDALSRSVDGMAANLPDEIEPNRQALTVDVPAPFLRRAERSRQLLAEQGLTGEQIAELGDQWIAAIAAAGIDAENLTLSAPEELTSAAVGAAAVLVTELPSVLEDPSLDTTQFDIGPSIDYIAVNCPDQGTLAGNDDVGSGGA